MLSRDGEPTSPSWLQDRDSPADPSAVSASLDRIRTSVHRWLDRIDELAAAAVEAARSAETKRAALQAELERREREWAAQVESLEHDRRQLAEAWERLEREQIAAMAMGRPADEPYRAPRPAPPPEYDRRSAELDDSVDRAIIRQFEALRKDVRRAAESRGVSST
jgi:DNA repair exonuclease SbcCD ATPase subunit